MIWTLKKCPILYGLRSWVVLGAQHLNISMLFMHAPGIRAPTSGPDPESMARNTSNAVGD